MKCNDKIVLPKLPRGEGSFTMKNDTIYFRKFITLNDGSKTRVGVQGKTAKECMESMRLEEIRLNKQYVKPSKELLIDAMNFWLVNVKKNELKEQSYRRLKGTIKNQIDGSDIAKVRYQSMTTDDLQLFINSLNNGKYSYSTIKKAYDALHEFYEYSSIKYRFYNPMQLVVKPSEQNTIKDTKEIVWFEQDDIDKFVAQAGAKWKTGRIRYNGGLAFAANIYLGLRIGELLALQWKDVDFENKRLYVCKTLIEIENPNYDKENPKSKKVLFIVQESSKTSENRYVPMNEKAITLLSQYKTTCKYTDPTDYIISTCNRKTTTEKNANDTIKAIQKAAGTKVQGASSHSLRHTFASLLYKKGIRSEIIADLMGNSPEVMRDTYLHFEEMQKYNAVNLMAREIIEL